MSSSNKLNAPPDDKNSHELEKFTLKNVERTQRKLGVGSFGAVEEVMVGGTRYAAKRLHDNLLDSFDQGHTKLVERFVSECKMMSALRHPNVVSFMGLCFFPESSYPVLVMEQLNISLDDLLEKKKGNLSLAPKLHILHDITTGLDYLHEQHSPPIIHRDLTTRNILLNSASMQAKIADLGNALMIDPSKFSSTLTQIPGTLVYMPPEAIVRKPKYDSSLDMFSFGHLALYTIIQEFPADLEPSTYTDPETDELKPRSELERRKKYFAMLYEKLSKDHAMCKLIRLCLSNKPSGRPKASVAMEEIEDMIGEQDDPYEVFVEAGKLDLLELLQQKNDNGGVQENDISGAELPSRTEQIKNGAPHVLEIYQTGGLMKRTEWRMRMFKMTTSNHLLCFKQTRGSFKTIDEINLADVTTCTPIEKEDKSKFYFAIETKSIEKKWILRAHTEEERKSWMTAILSSSTRRYTYSVSPRPRNPPTRVEEACYEDVAHFSKDPQKFQSNEAYNVTEVTRRRKSSKRRPISAIDLPLPPTSAPPPPALNTRPMSTYYESPKPANRPPALSSVPEEKQSVSNTYTDLLELSGAWASLVSGDGNNLYDYIEIPEAVRSNEKSPSSTTPKQEKESPPHENENDPELYDNMINPSPDETYDDMTVDAGAEVKTKSQVNVTERKGAASANVDILNPSNSPLKLEETTQLDPSKHQMMMLIEMQMMMQKINDVGLPKLLKQKPPPSSPLGKYHPPPPPPADSPLEESKQLDEPQCIYDQDMSEELDKHFKMKSRKGLYENIWEGQSEGQKPPPPPVPLKPKPQVPPKPTPAKLQEHNRKNSGSRIASKSVFNFRPSFKKKHGNLQQNFTDMKKMLGNLLVQNEKMSSNSWLVNEEEEDTYIDRPQWTKASALARSTLKNEEDTLIALQRQALFIPRSSVQNLQKIGQGQFGKVFQAEYHKGAGMSIPVAVKTIKKYKSEKETDDFLREMTVMSQMIHPNVVRLYGLMQQTAPWMVLELLPHGDLKNFLTENARPVQKLIKYMLDVAVGMHYIAEKGLIHRDLAARNVMVGENEICKVADFGLLREIPPNEEIYIQSSETPVPIRWMAPESLQKRYFSTASDVWSYGILLWEMFQPTKLPYEEYPENVQCAVNMIQGYRLQVPEPYPSTVKKIMKSCWHKTPEKRPSFLLISSLLTNETFGHY